MKILISVFLIFYSFTIFPINCVAQNNFYKNGMVSSADEIASEIGIEVMKKGGNAIDASVAVGFALAVVYPQAGNIGGGGFMVIHLNDGRNTSIDYREKAPLLSHRDMFLDKNGNVIDGLSTTGHLSGGVPGSVKGLLFALEKYGTMKREEVLTYAINLAENGFEISPRLAKVLNEYQNQFSKFPSTMKIFGKNWKAGDLLIQKDLANTLRLISNYGAEGFYTGYVADKIVEEMKLYDGLISYEDLLKYEAKERAVVTGTYKGYEIISMGPPSSGGISLIYLLNILEQENLGKYGYGSADAISVMTEGMRVVYADRSEHMADIDFYEVPVNVLTSKEYARKRFDNFGNDRARNSDEIKPGNIAKEKENTTHYSIADKDGNCVSVTTTINDNFGSKLVIEGAGFFLNNEMDDFVSKPGVPNMFGLLGSEANSISPEKRMLSSMTPTIVLKDGKPFMITGSPGGGRIITAVLMSIINVIDFGMNIVDAVDKPRFHHQWYPDEIQAENGMLSETVRKELVKRGYKINDFRDYASLDVIIFNDNGEMRGHSDRRGYGKAIGY
ncbi:MAG TPA: gamma-glutamyltransferase [Ignavibacteria bacterium]|nr:gamma-glutamyltransferase [Ignavibacteria bacterium]